jgi:hypothetical protein
MHHLILKLKLSVVCVVFLIVCGQVIINPRQCNECSFTVTNTQKQVVSDVLVMWK